MYICICMVVSRITIEQVIASGAHSVEEVGERCAAGTDCGKCRTAITRMLAAAEAAGGPGPGSAGTTVQSGAMASNSGVPTPLSRPVPTRRPLPPN